MGKYDQIISEARALMTDAFMKSANYELGLGSLKFTGFMENLQSMITTLESEELRRSRSLINKLKSIMFINEKESMLDETAADITEAVYRIGNCLKCKCSNCVDISPACNCEGCLYGSYVVECDDGIETRGVDMGVCEYNGLIVKRTVYSKASKSLAAIMIDDNYIESTDTISR